MRCQAHSSSSRQSRQVGSVPGFTRLSCLFKKLWPVIICTIRPRFSLVWPKRNFEALLFRLGNQIFDCRAWFHWYHLSHHSLFIAFFTRNLAQLRGGKTVKFCWVFFVPCFASLSAVSFCSIPQCALTYLMVTLHAEPSWFSFSIHVSTSLEFTWNPARADIAAWE